MTCQQQQQVNNPLWSLCMWMTLYTDTQNQQLRWRWLEVQHEHFVSIRQPVSRLNTMLCRAAQLRLEIQSRNRQLMQTQKFVDLLGPKFGAQIVEQSNDQGLKLSLCPQGRVVHTKRRVVWHWWTKWNTLISAVLFVNFFSSVKELYSYKYYYLYYWTCSSVWLIAGCL